MNKTKPGSDCYVVIAIDEDYRVRECVVVTDLPMAHRLRDHLRGIWGDEKVCLLPRAIDAVPGNLELSAMIPADFGGRRDGAGRRRSAR